MKALLTTLRSVTVVLFPFFEPYLRAECGFEVLVHQLFCYVTILVQEVRKNYILIMLLEAFRQRWEGSQYLVSGPQTIKRGYIAVGSFENSILARY